MTSVYFYISSSNSRINIRYFVRLVSCENKYPRLIINRDLLSLNPTKLEINFGAKQKNSMKETLVNDLLSQ
jgi:hypothetical protein